MIFEILKNHRVVHIELSDCLTRSNETRIFANFFILLDVGVGNDFYAIIAMSYYIFGQYQGYIDTSSIKGIDVLMCTISFWVECRVLRFC